MHHHRLMILGSGELGKEFVIAAKRLGLEVVAVDRYPNAPAMQVADHFEVINMLDANELDKIVAKHRPTIIVPEVEAIRTEKLVDFEKAGIFVVPTAKAAHLTMNRDVIRDLASDDLGLRTAKFAYATSLEQLKEVAREVGYPSVLKPVMSSSGKGQSVVKSEADLERAFNDAITGARGDTIKVIIEEFIAFEEEITLLTVRQHTGETRFVDPIGHRQEKGDYRESWIPAYVKPELLEEAKKMATKVTNHLGGAGLFGVEFFLTKDTVYFSELSPRPHDTGMVTMISQNLSEFELHLRAILDLPIPSITYYGPSASAVILADSEMENFEYVGIDEALNGEDIEVRIFGKPTTRPYRRMGVALARGKDTDEARERAFKAANAIRIVPRS